MRPDIREYFESRIERITESGCWIWMGATTAAGYGVISDKPKQTYAHRASWTLFRGTIPEGMYVCHRCDNPPCCNPDHLFIGTDADNMADKVAKGRQPRGEDYDRKLTGVDVATIIASRERGDILAKRYGVSRAMISAIKHGNRWAHIDRPDGPVRRHSSKLTEAQANEVSLSNEPQSVIAAKYGISQTLVSRIRTGKRWLILKKKPS